jgi:hypothetical protein
MIKRSLDSIGRTRLVQKYLEYCSLFLGQMAGLDRNFCGRNRLAVCLQNEIINIKFVNYLSPVSENLCYHSQYVSASIAKR